ncbi:amino acid adenylation domain-containing protein [uncultured Kordia sp.]|uniref:amino acid adenylation domain-containing protein n=1 Tax=uncultured Kordia sp. TaxID=507699 RepID=UPI00263606ED|nr:amino acid adenylation domain-containing protein [uncultured Kordia sp.]
MDELIQNIDENLETTICGLIKKQMLASPERIAIVDGTTRIDYKTLLEKVDEVAGELKHRNVLPGSLVGVCMNRSWELIAALIGVMQAGCAYVPLDPSYPEDRIKYMLKNSRAVITIVDAEQTANLCKDATELIQIDNLGNHKSAVVKASANALAYIIYTSGSTGKPKGVAVEHRSAVAMSQSMRALFSDAELNGMLAAASVCFDTSVMEIMGTLALGGKIILAQNALDLNHIPAVAEVRTCVMVPSSVQALLSVEDLPSGIKTLIFGGEALKRSLVKQVFDQKSVSRVFNFYGPTEDTVFSTVKELFEDTEIVTIGKSVKNSNSYILDENLQLLPIGEAGELYLAGSKLARGYLYDEEKTKERFVEIIPSDLIPHKRLYKTGDLCSRLQDGDIEFLGRVDQQVKIRGFRIELEEIESTLETMKGIKAAAASVIEGGIGQKILAVYVVTDKDMSPTKDSIKLYLSKRLPKYMIPQVVNYLDKLPLLPNDKLDRKKLSSVQHDNNCTSASTTGKEFQKLTKLSTEELKSNISEIVKNEFVTILNLASSIQISPDESFENYGLDSLSTLEFSSRLSNALAIKLSAHVIFENPTLHTLSNYIATVVSGNEVSAKKQFNTTLDSLATFQSHIQSSHPTFQAAKVTAWSVTDKSKLVQEVMRMVNTNRRNPYGKVLKTGSATKGIVGDAYNDEVQEAIIWTTNLYLGLNRDREVMNNALSALENFGTGMGTSAAASGMTNQHLEFETEFANLVGKPSACLFPTGYTANVGAVAGLLGKNDVVVIDQLCHASIVDGARLCGATVRTFKHNNVADLESVLQSEVSPYNTILVVLEGVYSMGEGAAPVAEIVRMAKKYNALVLVDEAHSFGFYGENGAGICADQGVTEEVDFIMTTLSKALGSLGGVVAANHEHVDLLKSSSRAYIFQASISPADMAAALTALRRLRSDATLQERLWDTTRYMRTQFEDAGYDLGTGDGPIVTPHFEDKDKLYAIVQSLYKRGVQTSAVTYPIVESGKGRLRFICSAAHTKADVDKTLEALILAEKEVDLELASKRNKVETTNTERFNLDDWSDRFVNYLRQSIATKKLPTPDLQITLKVEEDSEPFVMLIKEGTVTTSTLPTEDISFCSFVFDTEVSMAALQACDIQELLASICNGSCKLKGQTEPFIWFFSRLIDYKKDAQILSDVTHTASEEAIA